jgi:hypothetical protein
MRRASRVSSSVRAARIAAVLPDGPSRVRAPGRVRSSASGLAFAACAADLGVGDLVGEEGVDLGGLGGGVSQTAHHLDGHWAALDAAPEAYHNPAAIWWGLCAFRGDPQIRRSSSEWGRYTAPVSSKGWRASLQTGRPVD